MTNKKKAPMAVGFGDGLGRPRGVIKQYREHLNALDVGDSKHRHLCYHQKTRKYGDYLYHQDRERFMVELDEWIRQQPKPV